MPFWSVWKVALASLAKLQHARGSLAMCSEAEPSATKRCLHRSRPLWQVYNRSIHVLYWAMSEEITERQIWPRRKTWDIGKPVLGTTSSLTCHWYDLTWPNNPLQTKLSGLQRPTPHAPRQSNRRKHPSKDKHEIMTPSLSLSLYVM